MPDRRSGFGGRPSAGCGYKYGCIYKTLRIPVYRQGCPRVLLCMLRLADLLNPMVFLASSYFLYRSETYRLDANVLCKQHGRIT